MSFDPDKWLAATQPAPTAFDPDAWLKATETKPAFDPDAWLKATAEDQTPGTFSGALNSARRGVRQAGQTVDAATLAQGAAMASDADEEPERVAAERLADPEPVRKNFDRYGPGAERVYTIALQKWQTRNAERDERVKNNARFAEGMRKESIPQLAGAIGRRQGEIEAIPQTEGKRQFDEAKTLGEAVKAVVRHPIDTVTGISAESLPASAPSLIMGLLGSVAGPGGTMLGAGGGSMAMEYGGKVLEELQAAGVDFQKPETVAALVQDPKKMAEIRAKSVKRGVPVALFDAMSAGIAGRLMRTPGRTIVEKLGRAASELGIQGAMGGAGEAAGSLAAGDEVSGKAVLAEMLGEVGSGSAEVATGAVRDRVLGAAPALDTGKNVPESEQTLAAQQEQLRAGRRPAQMFPLGTEELTLPDGMARVETERGVFHYNPRLITADEILSASAKGRENDVLAMGPFSKTDVERRAAAGEPRISVTERSRDGGEVKAVVATPSTAAQTAEALEATKTPGNQVGVEPLLKAVSQRPGAAGFVQEIMAQQQSAALAKQEAKAREAAEREARQQELARKKARFDETLAAARELAKQPQADFPAINGALQSIRFYAEDNSLGLEEPQRQAARTAVAYLEKRVAKEQAAWNQQQELAKQAAAAAEKAKQLAQQQARAAQATEFKAAEKAGIGADGALDYSKLTANQLAKLAKKGDQRAERALMERESRPADDRESLLEALRTVRLPLADKTLPEELHTMVFEEMTTAQRKRLTSTRAQSLDRVAEGLRERGFSTIQTPADVIDAVQRALRGEDVRADHGENVEQVEFAAAARRTDVTTHGISEATLEQPMAIVPAMTAEGWTADNRANAERLRQMLRSLAGRAFNGVTVTNGGVKHLARLLRDPAAFRVAANLPDLLAASVPLAEETHQAGTRREVFERRISAAELDGQTIPVRITVRRDGARAELYHVDVLTNEARPSSVSRGGTPEGAASRIETGAGLKVRDLLPGVKQEADGSYTAEFAGAAPAAPERPALSEAEAEREMAAIRKAFPELTREYDIEVGLVEDSMRRRGYRGAVPAAVQAAVLRLRAQRSLIVLASRAYRDRAKGAALLTHEVAHTYWDTLPSETQEQLRELHAREVDEQSGPLYREGNIQTELAYVEDLDENGHKEWFAERIARLNEAWAKGQIDRAEHTLLMRLAYQVRELVRQVWATIAPRDGIDPDSELFVREFRRFFAGGADQSIGRAAGTAYAQRVQAATAKFATGKPDPDEVIRQAPHVEALPPVDRKGAMIAELKRARAMRDQGIKAGNWDAEQEGQTRVSQLMRALDDDFPGWDSPSQESTKGETPAEVESDQPGLATDEDGGAPPDVREASPFRDEDPEPVRAGKWNEVYGQDGYSPTALARSWRRVRDVITGIKGAIPELPTFPAAAWNKADRFIREQGPQFYNRVKEGLRALRSGNDYVQRTAEEQVARIVRPLIEVGGKFAADDYAKLRRAQETARRLKAEERTVPAGLRARIAALNSKLESSPYVLFNRLVLALDLHWRQQNLKDSEGNPIALPANVNAAETAAELQRLGERIETSEHAELIKTALREHMALVKQVADDLQARELLAAEQLQNPYYFPHITLETTRGGKTEQRELRVERVRPGTEADFRGYLIDPVGSAKPISTDYVRSMYFHLVQVGAHNLHADVVRDFFRPYDVKAKVEERAKQLTKERGVPVSWQQAFNEDFSPDGYVMMGVNDVNPFGAITVNRDALARRIGVMLTSEDLQKQLHELGLRGVTLLPEDLKETFIEANKEVWIVPARVAEALRGVAKRETQQDNIGEGFAKWTLGQWKAWKLFMPQSHFRYETNNMLADLEKIASAAPRTFLFVPEAAKEVRNFWLGSSPSDDLRAALKEGVINAVTAQELGALQRLPQFNAFETTREKLGKEIKAALSAPLTNLTRLLPSLAGNGLLGRVTSVEQSAFREAVLRYAKFKSDLAAIRNGSRPQYAGAYWRDIEAMKDSAPGASDADVRKAAAIAKATFVDYGDMSVTGEWLREKLVPFYSWIEGNFKYHANLLRNLRDMVRAGETSHADATKAGARAAAVFAAGFTARVATGVLLRLALPYFAAYAWNNSGDRDELEKLLSDEDRRRFHIILGRNADGSVNVYTGNTALMDVLRWFSGQKFGQAMAGWIGGKTDFPTAFSEWRDEIVPDAINNVAQGLTPWLKLPYTYASKKNPFPDVLDQRTIPAYDMRRAIMSQITDDLTADQIERIVNKDYYPTKDAGDHIKQIVLQMRRRDPEAWAFYEIKDKAADFLQRKTGASRDSSFDAPDQQVLRNFRKAIYRGDVEKATEFYQRLLAYGYTAERFKSSIRAQEPLAGLPKALRKEFVAGLSEFEREQLQRAFEYYTRMSGAKGHERQLFPSQRWGERGMQRYQTQPRTDRLRQIMDQRGGMTDEEVQRRAEFDLRQSLRKR